MDANVYEARLKELKEAFAKVDFRIKVFGPEDVTLLDKDTYKDYLEETRKLLLEAQEAAFDLRSKSLWTRSGDKPLGGVGSVAHRCPSHILP